MLHNVSYTATFPPRNVGEQKRSQESSVTLLPVSNQSKKQKKKQKRKGSHATKSTQKVNKRQVTDKAALVPFQLSEQLSDACFVGLPLSYLDI